MKMAVDIGGTYLRYEIIGKKKDKKRLDKIDLQNFLIDLIKKENIKKLSISYAGQVYKNKILSSPNINAFFEPKNLGIDYIIENDLNCAALAESRFFKQNYIAALYPGTGLGLGVIEDGKIIKGFKNLSCEIGHIPYKKAPFKCGCGKDNCIELYASGSGIKKWAKELNCSDDLKNTCKRIKDMFNEAFLYACATVITLFNPKVLVLGGGIIKNNPSILDFVKENIKYYAPNFSLDGLDIVKTSLEDASLEGAKILLKGLK